MKNGRYVENGEIVCWYQEGKLHRDNAPAVEYPWGSCEWLQHGLLHRLDGPAKEIGTSVFEYWIEGIQYTEEEFHNYIEKKELNQSLDFNLRQKKGKAQLKV